ncbi:diguanylate cyclase (GGDEF) domain protein [compost metagenome]
MSLRSRLLCLSVPLVLATLLIVNTLSNSLLLARFDSNDERQLVDQANNLALQIDSFISRSLDVLRSDAFSKETYWSIQNANRGLPTSADNDSEKIRYQDFNFLLYFDSGGRIVGEHWAMPDMHELFPDRIHPREQQLRADIIERSIHLGLLQMQDSAHAGSAQLVSIRGIPVVLVSSPISNILGAAPPVGNAIAGRFLVPQRIHRLERFISGKLSVVPTEAGRSDVQPIPSQQHLTGTAVKLGARQLVGSDKEHIDLLFDNRLDEPEVTLRISAPRAFYLQGHDAVRFFLLLSSCVAAVAIVLIYIGLDRWVLRRIRRLHHEVESIGPDTPRAQLSTLGNDELGQLTGDLNHMLERLAQSEDRDQAILDNIRDGYFEIDRAGRFTSGNRALCELLACPADGLGERSLQELLGEGDDTHSLDELLASPDSTSGGTLHAILRAADGRYRHFEAHLSAVRSSTGELIGHRGILHDITEQMTYQKQLHDLAYRDALTGLGNRKAFDECLQLRLGPNADEMQSAALFFIDLDRFKQVNDSYGHDVGDALLVEVAHRLRTCLRPLDRTFRLGGDEFTALLDNVDRNQAAALAQRLLGALGQAYEVSGQHIDFITPSIGIALYPEHGEQPEALLKAADSAMYQAKIKRNAFHIHRAAYEEVV